MKTIVSKLNRFVQPAAPSNADKCFDTKNTLHGSTTVKQFNQQFHQLIATHGLTQSATNDILTILRDHTSSLDLPLLEIDKIPFASKPIKSNCITDFIESDVHDFTTNICRHECMVFSGMQKSPHPDKTTGLHTLVNCSVLLKCMFCHSPRFSKCCNVRCRQRKAKYEDCDPFHGGHSLLYRTSMKDVYYRTIIGKLIQLYCLSQLEGFEHILSYDELRVKKDGQIIDLLDGAEFKLQKSRMSDNYERVKSKWNAGMSSRGELFECSLMLTISYDGVVNFKRKLDSMWPLMTSVVNCNPSHRAKLGTGMFVSMLHNCSVGSGVENFMMQEMLVAELKKLESGLIFSIPAHDGVPERNVYLQARLLYTHLDTKALEKCAMLKLCNSLYGCLLCNLQTGATRPSLLKCVHTGCRLPLHKHHVMRSCGQREFQSDVFDENFPEKELLSASEKRRLYYQGDTRYSQILKDECAAVLIDRVHVNLPPDFAVLSAPRFSRKRSVEKDIVWYHTDPRFSFDKFAKEVRFPFPDHRERKKFKRESSDEYITSGLIARERRQTLETLYATGVKKRLKNPTDCSYNGVKDVSPLVSELSSFNFENFCPDAMHMAGNISNNLLKVYKRERGLSDGSRVLAISQQTHVILKFKKVAPRWSVSLGQQDSIDAVVNGLLIPPNYKSDFSFKNPFKHRGHLKARDHMIWLMVYSSFALSFSSMGSEYITFTAMLAADLCDIFNPSISVADLHSIINRVYETRAVFEGLYPESEQVIIWHQLIDIVNHIRKFGHLRGLMCYSSERANGFISQSLTKGGVRYLSTMYNRYVIKESSMLGRFLVDTADTSYNNDGIYSDFSLSLLGKSYDVIIHDKDTNGVSFLFSTVFSFLATQELDNLFELSPFYRLYSAYEFLKDNHYSSTGGFYSWLCKLYSLYMQPSPLPSGDSRYLKYCVNFCTDYRACDVDFTDSVLGHVFEQDLVLMAKAIVSPTGNLKVIILNNCFFMLA